MGAGEPPGTHGSRTSACAARRRPAPAAGALRTRGRGRGASPARSRQRGLEGTDEGDRIAVPGEPHRAGAPSVGQLSDHPDHRRGEDRAGRSLVVEGDVAAHHGHAKGLARLGQAFHGLDELPGHVRLLRIAEVEAVGQPERLGADAGQVGRAFVHRLGRPRRGSHAARRPLPSIETAIAEPAGSARTAASASSGRRTVRDWTSGSYCSNTGRREARLTDPRRASRISAGLAASARRGRRWIKVIWGRRRRLEVVQRALVDEHVDRELARPPSHPTTLATCRPRSPPRSRWPASPTARTQPPRRRREQGRPRTASALGTRRP